MKWSDGRETSPIVDAEGLIARALGVTERLKRWGRWRWRVRALKVIRMPLPLARMKL